MLGMSLRRFFLIPLLGFISITAHATVYEEHSIFLEYYGVDVGGAMRFKLMRPLVDGTDGYSLGCKNSAGVATGEIQVPTDDKMANGFIMDLASGAPYLTAQVSFNMNAAGVCTLQKVRLIRGI